MTRSARRSFHSFLRGILFLLACTYATSAQTARQQITIVEQSPARRSSMLPLPQGFQQFVQHGKLELSLADAIQLALENNTDIQIDE